MTTSTIITLQAVPLTHVPRLAQPIGRAVASAVAVLSSWMRPRSKSPAAAATDRQKQQRGKQ
jgi:hypothetical protein